jgi:uncharacterized phage protein (TIGR01671 family)
MREILFRGQREEDKAWVFGMPCATEKSGIYAIQTLEGGIFDIIPETLGQYIGLTDRNNKNIFEGDIVKVYDIFGKVDGVGIVRWSDLFLAWHTSSCKSMYSDELMKYEVVGTIYDGPGLLEEDE